MPCNLLPCMQEISCLDVVDILLVGLLLYVVYKLIEGSTAIKIALGFGIIYLCYRVVEALKLRYLGIIFSKFTGLAPLFSVILFQREIRYFLSTLGKGAGIGKGIVAQLFPWLFPQKVEIDVTPVVKAVQVLGRGNIGALIVFTKDADLRYYEASGDLIDAVVSSRLLIAIFNKESPLHDGAVIIHNNKIAAARCILPVTENPNVASYFGLRHKAALGLTEITDTLAVVVSEESGQVSIARNGKIESNLSVQEIRSTIKDYLNKEWRG
ncbi:MAG: diadenylate cyclase [Candidatus Cardinium sp.]|nr:diadenylate cyclase [Candidatus Cardinium sp.]